jgi:hypothetical protein
MPYTPRDYGLCESLKEKKKRGKKRLKLLEEKRNIEKMRNPLSISQ